VTAVALDVTQVRSLLDQAQHAARGKADASSPTRDFADLLSKTSQEQKASEKAFEKYAVEGQGELHEVMAQIAKADVTFRFLLEVRNKLTDAYLELSRLQV
jgi:flagellar hook-basal body complex protein FliE